MASSESVGGSKIVKQWVSAVNAFSSEYNSVIETKRKKSFLSKIL